MIDKKVLVLLAVIGGAGVFAATRTRDATPQLTPAAPEPAPSGAMPAGSLPPGHPPMGDLPAGHPPIGGGSGGHGGAAGGPAMVKPDASILWTMPPRWEAVPHMSSMRIVTYRVPKVVGDIEDAEVSVTRAGGDIEQNATRWIQQFDEASRPSAKRSTKTIGTLKVHVVEVEGGYTTMKGEVEKDWAMIGAIVDTPDGSHFFKLTGPKKSVANAKAEMDALIASIKAK